MPQNDYGPNMDRIQMNAMWNDFINSVRPNQRPTVFVPPYMDMGPQPSPTEFTYPSVPPGAIARSLPTPYTPPEGVFSQLLPPSTGAPPYVEPSVMIPRIPRDMYPAPQMGMPVAVMPPTASYPQFDSMDRQSVVFDDKRPPTLDDLELMRRMQSMTRNTPQNSKKQASQQQSSAPPKRR